MTVIQLDFSFSEPRIPFVTLKVISGYQREIQNKNNYSKVKENTSFRIHTERPPAERLSSGRAGDPVYFPSDSYEGPTT
jgi:hypothetical protein